MTYYNISSYIFDQHLCQNFTKNCKGGCLTNPTFRLALIIRIQVIKLCLKYSDTDKSDEKSDLSPCSNYLFQT